MGVVSFDPTCFIDELYAAGLDHLHSEFQLIPIDRLDRVQMYITVQQILFTEADTFAHPISENNYIMSEDDLYTIADKLTDVIIKLLDLEEGEFDSELIGDGQIVDEYDEFFRGGSMSGFTEADDLRGIVMQMISVSVGFSVKRLTGKVSDIKANIVEVD